MKMSVKARELEGKFQKPIRQIVKEAYDQAGSMRGAAKLLDLNENTYGTWFYRLGLTVSVTKEATRETDTATVA